MRNIATGNISPQFHVVFDDKFETVSTDFQDPSKSLDIAFSSDQWRTLLQTADKFFHLVMNGTIQIILTTIQSVLVNIDVVTSNASILLIALLLNQHHIMRERMNNMSLLNHYMMEMFL